MNTSIRKVALTLGIVFLALFINLNVVQLGQSTKLANDPRNRRHAYEEEAVQRGDILAADGTIIAESYRSGDSRFIWSRRYPLGDLFGHITGYYTSPFFCDSAGIERTQTDVLSGREPVRSQDYIDQLLGRRHDGNILRLTVEPELQRLARAKFGSQRGGVAVIDTHTGAVLALYGTPTYDPNVITREKLGDCARARGRLDRNPGNVLLSRAYQVRYPPGSTMKIITAAAGLENKMTPYTSFPDPRVLDLPDTDKVLRNFGGGSCQGGGSISIATGLRISCNTTFAQVALRIGAKKLVAMADKFGLNQSVPFDLDAIPSCISAPFTGDACDVPELSRPFVAYSGIGQGDVRMTPLQLARITATVETGGYVPRPHVVAKILDENGALIERTQPQHSARIYSKQTARWLKQMMIDVVRYGTGAIVGFASASRGIIGGKTGTAQTGIPGQAPHVWFTAFGPGVAVAVVVENGGTLRSEATGGRVAGPIAKAMLERALAMRARTASTATSSRKG